MEASGGLVVVFPSATPFKNSTSVSRKLMTECGMYTSELSVWDK